MLQLLPRPELHPVFETLGYALGFAAYRKARRQNGDVIDHQHTGKSLLPRSSVPWWEAVCSVCQRNKPAQLSRVRFLTPEVGGWLGVELTRSSAGFRVEPKTCFVIPLCIGIAVGRIGCLLAGLADRTYGNLTSLPWGINFGDGIAQWRHLPNVHGCLPDLVSAD